MDRELINTKIWFYTADGQNHRGVIEDIIPQIGGGQLLSVWCSALGKTLAITEEQLNKS